MPAVKIISARRIDAEEPQFTLSFVAASDDPDYRDTAYQSELHAIDGALRERGLRPQARANFQKSATGGSWLTGDFLLPLTALAVPLAGLLGSWLTARLGRKVRVKVGEIEVEAANVAEADELLKKALAIKKKIDPKP